MQTLTTTFIPSASTSITDGSAPFNGTYSPEQDFSNLTGSADGTWTLSVYDDGNGDEGTLLEWSITYTSNPSYSWTPTASLNNPSIYNPTATPSTNTTYTMTATLNGCEVSDDVIVTILPDFTSGEINTTNETICYNGDPGLIGNATAASGGDNSINYEWRADGVSIASSNSATYDPPTGLTSTTTYTRWAQDGTCNTGWSQSIGSWVVTVRPDFNSGSVLATGETICMGTDASNISSLIPASGGDNNITYKWQANGSDIASSNSASFDPSTGLITNTTYTRWAKDNTCNTGWTQSTGSWVVTITSAPLPGGLGAGDYFWTGAIDNSWDNTSNWLYYNGTNYTVASVLPDASSNVFIESYSGVCATTNALTSATSTVYCEDLNIITGLSLGGLSQIEVTGNWNNSGTFSAGTGTVTFNGTSNQIINSGGSSFNDVIFNNSSASNSNIELTTPMIIEGDATFTDGIVYYSGTGSLSFGNNASASISSNNGFVNGLVTKTGSNEFVFPLGNVSTQDFDGSGAIEYAVAGALGIHPTVASTVTAQYNFSNTGMPDWWGHDGNMDLGLHHVSNRENWVVNSDQDLTVTLYWFDNAHADGDICIHGLDNGISSDFDASDLVVAFWDGSMWANIDYNSSPVLTNISHDAGYITSRFDVSFGAKANKIITFGSKNGTNPLPVELLAFSGNCDNGSINFEWTTASEINNDYFVIEESFDMNNFEPIIEIHGAGNSNSIINYYENFKTTSQNNYYRIVQVDFDGKATVYPPIVVLCEENNSEEPILAAYPNPFRNELIIELNNFNENEVIIQIFDQLGKIVYQKLYTNTDFNNMFYLNLDNLKPSIYNLRLVSDKNILNQKLIKN